MVINSKYTFEVSVSNEGYENKEISGAMIQSCKFNPEVKAIRKKYGFRANKGVGFKRSTETCESLMNKLIHGHVMCGLFNPLYYRKDGTFSATQKTNMGFLGSYHVGVDIDKTDYGFIESILDVLPLKPSFYYTSYSNGVMGNLKCRLVYVFDELIFTPNFFRFVSYTVNTMVENAAKKHIEIDKTAYRCTQYFNGTNVDNKSLSVQYGNNNIIYNFDDFNINYKAYKDFIVNKHCAYVSKNPTNERELYEMFGYDLSLCKYIFDCHDYNKKNNAFINAANKFEDECKVREDCIKKAKTDNTLMIKKFFSDTDNFVDNYVKVKNIKLNNTFVYDMKHMDYDTFMCYNRHKYKYFYRVEKSVWINGLYQLIDDNYFALYYNVFKVKDGQSRRKKLYQRMCLRRVMRPDVTAEELLFNAYEDAHRFFELDKDLTIDNLISNVKSAMSKSISEIEIEFKDAIAYLKSRRPKKGVIFFNRAAHTKETTYIMLDEMYDHSLTVEQNVINLKIVYGVDLRTTTLYDYIKNNGYRTVKQRQSDGLKGKYDFKKTLRENWKYINDNFVKISLGKLQKLSVIWREEDRIETELKNKVEENKKNNEIDLNNNTDNWLDDAISQFLKNNDNNVMETNINYNSNNINNNGIKLSFDASDLDTDFGECKLIENSIKLKEEKDKEQTMWDEYLDILDKGKNLKFCVR